MNIKHMCRYVRPHELYCQAEAATLVRYTHLAGHPTSVLLRLHLQNCSPSKQNVEQLAIITAEVKQMSRSLYSSGPGLGGPGMWDPMPLPAIPPLTPRSEEPQTTSQLDSERVPELSAREPKKKRQKAVTGKKGKTATDVSAARKTRTGKGGAKKATRKAVKKKAAKKAVKKAVKRKVAKTVKKRTTKKTGVKHAARKKTARRTSKKKATRAKKTRKVAKRTVKTERKTVRKKATKKTAKRGAKKQISRGRAVKRSGSGASRKKSSTRARKRVH